ncbi:MAG TPA: hypothetical protein VMF32_19570 [Xanthobacteraceae bacterium]|nr:hypothetical protein [Xanthobacteraceae bacterium]
MLWISKRLFLLKLSEASGCQEREASETGDEYAYKKGDWADPRMSAA